MNGNPVSAAFDALLAELAKEHDGLVPELNAATTRKDWEAVTSLAQTLKQVDGLKADVDQLKRKWHSLSIPPNSADTPPHFAIAETAQLHSVSPADDTETGQSGDTATVSNPPRRRASTDRLQHGLKTPNDDYERPILETLVEIGGAGKTRDVLDQVEKKMRHILNDEYDYGTSQSKKNVPRWRHTAELCRNKMVKDRHLKQDSPRGVWEITDSGRNYLRHLQRQN